MNLFLELFASKRFFSILRESCAFFIKSFFKYWFFSLPILAALCYVLWDRRLYFSKNEINWHIAGSVIISGLPGAFRLYYTKTRFSKRKSSFFIGISELVLLKEKEYLTLNADSERINQKLKLLVSDVSSRKYPYKEGISTIQMVERPKLFYLFRSIASLSKYWKTSISKEKIDMVLSYILDNESSFIEFDVSYQAENVSNSENPFKAFKDVFNIKLESNTDRDKYVINVSKFYLAICGQSILDLVLDSEDYLTAHKIVDDSEGLLLESFESLKPYFRDSSAEKLQHYVRMWQCNMERYRGIIFLNQKQYSHSLNHVIRSLQLWPYYPYMTYNEYRDEYHKKYMASINLTASAVMPEIDDESFKERDKDKEAAETFIQGIDLLERSTNAITPSAEDVIKWIAGAAATSEFFKELEEVLTKDFCEAPICDIIRAEVLKYLPKGSTQEENMYLDRLPEVFEALNRILEKDPDFNAVYLKIGILKFIQSIYETNEVGKQALIEEFTRNFQKGLSLYHRMTTLG